MDGTYPRIVRLSESNGEEATPGEVLRLEPVDLPLKLEGVHAQVHGARVRLLLTADADDPEKAAPLLSAEL